MLYKQGTVASKHCTIGSIEDIMSSMVANYEIYIGHYELCIALYHAPRALYKAT